MIIDQLKSYCDCVEVNDRDVEELVELVSMATCWMQSPCETFLSAQRREVVELPECQSDCDIYEFTPFYQPFDSNSFTFTLVKQQGMEEESTPITDFLYSELDNVFRMKLPIPSCKCQPTCGCKSTYKLLVEYVAGYDELPECLLPVFCEALQYVQDKNKCDCDDCATCNNQDEPIVIDYENGATITDRLADYFMKMLVEQYKRELSLISLCNHRKEIWGIVV